MATVNTTRSERSVGSEQSTSFSTMMVHVDVEHDSERRVALAIGLADRFQSALIGVAGCALWPAFMAGDVALTKSNQYDLQKVTARFEQRGKKFRAQGRSLKQIDGAAPLSLPVSFSCAKHGRPISSSSVAGTAGTTPTPGLSCCGPAVPFCWSPTPSLRCRFAAWSSLGRTRVNPAARCGTRSRSCRRPRRLCSSKWRARIAVAGQEESGRGRGLPRPPSGGRGGPSLAPTAGPGRCRAPARRAGGKGRSNRRGGYGHSRLGEWIFGGVTRELLAASPVCCLLSH